jgi:hypothetical protein
MSVAYRGNPGDAETRRGTDDLVDVAGFVAMPVVLVQPQPSTVPVDAESRWQHPDIRFIGTDGC